MKKKFPTEERGKMYPEGVELLSNQIPNNKSAYNQYNEMFI